jgi:hypothetical protein
MKRIILQLFIIVVFAISSNVYGQVYFPKLKANHLTFFTDTLTNDPTTIPTYDTYNLRLLNWKNGLWYAQVTTMPGYKDRKVYVRDTSFVKTYEYRTELEKVSKKAKTENLIYLQSLQKKYGLKFGKYIYHETAEIGMTASMVRLALGSPKDVNRTRVGNGVHEQWVYYDVFGKERTDSKYYYIENGKLVAIQD